MRLAFRRKLFQDGQESSSRVDTCRTLLAVASFYKDWARSRGLPNTWPRRPAGARIPRSVEVQVPAGRHPEPDLNEVCPSTAGSAQVQESIAHSWLQYSDATAWRSTRGTARPSSTYTGPKPPYEQLEVQQKFYSWLKTPAGRATRWKSAPSPACSWLTRRQQGGAGDRQLDLKALDVPVAALFSDAGPDGGARPRNQARVRLGEGVLQPADSPTSRTATRGPPTCRCGTRRRWRLRPGAWV